MKILIFIEHDVIIRHFIHSNVFSELSNKHEVIYIFPEPGYKRVTINVSKLKLNAPYKYLKVHQRRLVIWKRLFQVNLFRWRKDPLYKALKVLHKEMVGFKAAVLYSALSLPVVFQLFQIYSFFKIKLIPNLELQDLINNEKPDLIIHPSVLEGVYINDLVSVSKEDNIPLIVIMNSWDNPCTKRAVVGVPDYLLVWGTQTWLHAIKYVGSRPENTIKFGTAQFEIYRETPRITRSEFSEKHDIDPNKKIILYAGSSKETDEFAHLTLIEDAIRKGKLKNAVVVYRPHPWGNGGKEGHRILEFPWEHIRIESTMRKYLEDLRDGVKAMSFPDYKDTHDTLSSVDVVVSPLSTIILEGALHAKPSLCFLPVEELDARHFQLAMPLKHFEDMFNMDEFPVAKGHEELISGIEKILACSEDKNFLKKLSVACKYFVEIYDEKYSERLVTLCESIVSSSKKLN